jgi:hypothetical protein
VNVLIGALPRESALARALAPNPALATWTHTDDLLALVAEQIDLGNRLLFSAYSAKGDAQPAPLRVRRPYEGELAAMAAAAAPEAPRMATSAEMVKFFGGTVRYFPDPA